MRGTQSDRSTSGLGGHLDSAAPSACDDAVFTRDVRSTSVRRLGVFPLPAAARRHVATVSISSVPADVIDVSAAAAAAASSSVLICCRSHFDVL